MTESWGASLSERLPDYRTLSAGFIVAIGVTLAILASFITCLGLNLQKLSLCAPGNEDVSPWRQPKWVAGFTCVVVGSVIDFVAFGLAPQSLLAPLAALSLIWNLGMASYLLGETTTRTDVKAAALIFLGTGLTVAFSTHESKEYTLEDLRSLSREHRVSVYAAVILALLGTHYLLTRLEDVLDLVEQTSALADKTAGLRRALTPRRMMRLEMLGYAGFAGIVGGQSMLFAKGTMELIKDAAHGDDVFAHYETYVFIVSMTVCLLAQITFLNGGLKQFDSLLVVPAYQSYWILSGTAGGLVYWGEFESFHGAQMLAFVMGTLVTLAGLMILTTKEHHYDGDGERDEHDDVDGYEAVQHRRQHTACSDGAESVASTTSLARSDALEGDVELCEAPPRGFQLKNKYTTR